MTAEKFRNTLSPHEMGTASLLVITAESHLADNSDPTCGHQAMSGWQTRFEEKPTGLLKAGPRIVYAGAVREI
jgi:hypothetical protein